MQMSERLLDLERALTAGTVGSTGVPDADGSNPSRRSLSVSASRKPSLSIRRTLSSFRCASRIPFEAREPSGSDRADNIYMSCGETHFFDGIRSLYLGLAHKSCIPSSETGGMSAAYREREPGGEAAVAHASQVFRGSPETDGSYSSLALCRRRTSDASQGLVGADASRAASIAGFEDLGDDSDCGICLESDHDVAVNGCNHCLCIDCAIRC